MRPISLLCGYTITGIVASLTTLALGFGPDCTQHSPPPKPVMFHPIQYTKDWSFGDPHQIGKPPQAWQQPEGVACLIVLDAERMRAIGNPVDIPRGFYTQLFVGNFPNFGDKLTMECETVEQ